MSRKESINERDPEVKRYMNSLCNVQKKQKQKNKKKNPNNIKKTKKKTNKNKKQKQKKNRASETKNDVLGVFL